MATLHKTYINSMYEYASGNEQTRECLATEGFEQALYVRADDPRHKNTNFAGSSTCLSQSHMCPKLPGPQPEYLVRAETIFAQLVVNTSAIQWFLLKLLMAEMVYYAEGEYRIGCPNLPMFHTIDSLDGKPNSSTFGV